MSPVLVQVSGSYQALLNLIEIRYGLIEAVEATSVVFASDVADTSLLVVVCCDRRGLVEGAGAAGGTGKRFAIWVVGQDGFEEVDWVVDVRCVWVEALEFR